MAADFADDIAKAFHTFEPEEVRECLRADLSDLGAEQAARQFARAEKLLQGLLWTFEDRGTWDCLWPWARPMR